MITPNKVVKLEQSALGLSPLLLSTLAHSPTELIVLYNKVAHKFEDISQFILTLDVLYVLGRIEIDFTTRVVRAY